jgi:hypothetical protein
MHSVMVAGVLGGIQDPLHIDRLLTRQADIAARLGQIDNELSQFSRLQSQLSEAAERLGITDIMEMNLRRVRDFKGEGTGGVMDMARKYQAQRAKLAALDAERVDLIGERFYIDSALKLDETTLPIRQLPSDKLLEELTATRVASERDPVESMLRALSRQDIMSGEDAELLFDLKRTLEARGAKPRQIQRVMNQARKSANGQARTVFRSWRHMNT